MKEGLIVAIPRKLPNLKKKVRLDIYERLCKAGKTFSLLSSEKSLRHQMIIIASTIRDIPLPFLPITLAPFPVFNLTFFSASGYCEHC
jgi:hypothetical protein